MRCKFSSMRLHPKNAEGYLSCKRYELQRDYRPSHKQELQEKIEDGRFHEGVLAIMHRSDGSDEMFNGQHQCRAVLDYGKSVAARLHEYWEENGDTAEEIARVFAQYDRNWARNRGQVARIYAGQYGMDGPKRWIDVCASSLVWIKAGGKTPTGRVGFDEGAKLLVEYSAECVFIRTVLFGEGVTNDKAKHMRRGPVVSAMMVSFQASPEAANRFWLAVRNGSGLEEGSPALACRDWLKGVTVNMGASSSGEKKTVTTGEAYGRCVLWWNKFCLGNKGGIRWTRGRVIEVEKFVD